MTTTDQNTDYLYELRNIADFASNDPKGRVKGSKCAELTEKQAEQLNYARALNGDPNRLIKIG